MTGVTRFRKSLLIRIIFESLWKFLQGKYVLYKKIPMASFELRTSGIGSHRSANCATTTDHYFFNCSSYILTFNTNQKSLCLKRVVLDKCPNLALAFVMVCQMDLVASQRRLALLRKSYLNVVGMYLFDASADKIVKQSVLSSGE